MKKVLLFFAMTLAFSQIAAQEKSSWAKVSALSTETSKAIRTTTYSENQQLLQWDEMTFRNALIGAPESGSGANGVVVSFPNVNGQTEKFVVWETSNFAPELRAQYPAIKSYIGKGITDKSAYLRFSLDTRGIQTMILRADQGAEFIQPYTTDRSVYVVFDSKTRTKGHLPFTCATVDHAVNSAALQRTGEAFADNEIFKTFRLALSCTSEYTTYFGGTVAGALEGMNATMTRVNGVLDVDMGVKLEIIADNSLVIFTNATTDPYSNATTGTNPANANNANGWNIQVQNALTNILGNEAYDIGHLFGASGGGGNAGCIGCICEDDTASTTDKNKGSAYTSPSDGIPEGDTFDIDYVIHEMGHQMGANHTFSYNNEGTGVNIEPGSGVTIMGYAGVSDGYDVQSNSEPFFAYRSILQMQTNLVGATCSVNTPMTNNKPIVDAGPNFTIPLGTAFILTGTGTDEDGDILTYVWEQNDNGTPATTGANSFPSPTKTSGPNFRSFLPTTSPIRFMPQYSTVLSGSLTSTWETVSTVARPLNFSFTARDNSPGQGQTRRDALLISVSGTAGPFAFTSQNTTGISWTQGSMQPVTWSVNNTTALAGSATVNIKLSLDNGLTWPITLATDTPNDGSEDIFVPNVASPNCRLWIEPTGNIYYAVNSTPFAIGYNVVTTCETFSYTTPYTIPNQAPGSFTTKTLTIPALSGTISDVNVFNNFTHQYLSDVQTDISSPTNPNSYVKLFNRSCGSQNDPLNLKFSDGAASIDCDMGTTLQEVTPAESLSAFNGQDAQGVWKFRVYDNFAPDTGTMNSWGIEICTQTATLATPGFDFADFSLYPNPTKGDFTVQFTSDSTTDVNIAVHDMRGRKIFENKFANTGLFSQTVQLDQAQTGVYLVTVQDGDRKIVKRIVIE